jgi:hypothetical protein
MASPRGYQATQTYGAARGRADTGRLGTRGDRGSSTVSMRRCTPYDRLP